MERFLHGGDSFCVGEKRRYRHAHQEAGMFLFGANSLNYKSILGNWAAPAISTVCGFGPASVLRFKVIYNEETACGIDSERVR